MQRSGKNHGRLMMDSIPAYQLRNNPSYHRTHWLKQRKQNMERWKKYPLLLQELHPIYQTMTVPFHDIEVHVCERSPQGHLPILWVCSKCGNGWFASSFSRVRGSGCPVCSE